jgi:hypothetical protein
MVLLPMNKIGFLNEDKVNPNCKVVVLDSGLIELYSLRPIMRNEELLINYSQIKKI